MTMKYEAPVLTHVGKAEDVIRGLVDLGADLDGRIFVGEFEFLNDEETGSVIGGTGTL
jgi:hypothetical protein